MERQSQKGSLEGGKKLFAKLEDVEGTPAWGKWWTLSLGVFINVKVWLRNVDTADTILDIT